MWATKKPPFDVAFVVDFVAFSAFLTRRKA
jgi:hypothetical protein